VEPNLAGIKVPEGTLRPTVGHPILEKKYPPISTRTGPIYTVPATVRVLKPAEAWARLQSLHQACLHPETVQFGAASSKKTGREQLPVVGAEGAKAQHEAAFRRYSDAVVLAIGSIAANPRSVRGSILTSLASYVSEKKSLAGLEGVFLTAVLAAKEAGDTVAVEQAAGAWATAGVPARLGGGALTSPIFNVGNGQLLLANAAGVKSVQISAATSGTVLGAPGSGLTGPNLPFGLNAEGVDWAGNMANYAGAGAAILAAGGLVVGLAAGGPAGALTGAALGGAIGGGIGVIIGFIVSVSQWLGQPPVDTSGPFPTQQTPDQNTHLGDPPTPSTATTSPGPSTTPTTSGGTTSPAPSAGPTTSGGTTSPAPSGSTTAGGTPPAVAPTIGGTSMPKPDTTSSGTGSDAGTILSFGPGLASELTDDGTSMTIGGVPTLGTDGSPSTGGFLGPLITGGDPVTDGSSGKTGLETAPVLVRTPNTTGVIDPATIASTVLTGTEPIVEDPGVTTLGNVSTESGAGTEQGG